MFAMSQHPYGYPPAPPPRQYSGTSSAFSSSANPDEDWTKISDLAERRRIQNRIAQRNYRKKLKRRLEDLERRAGTSDGASSSSEKQGSSGSSRSSSTAKSSKSPSKSSKSSSQPQQQRTPPQQAMMSPPRMHTSQFTPPMHHDDDMMFGHHYDDRERSHSPPGLFNYAYPPPEDMAPYGTSPPYAQTAYRPMTTSEAYPEYLVPTTVPVTLPSMTHFSDAIKRESYPGEEMPYMSYGYIPGMEVHSAAPYDHSNPHTPPLSHGFDHSANCSDAGYDYPTTPLSMPGSPGMIQH